VQDPRAGLRAPLGDGLSMRRPHARRRFGRARLARHRVRGGGPMNVPVLPKAKMNVPEFLAWAEMQSEGRFELVDGEVVAMSPECLLHGLVKLAVARALEDAVQAAHVPCTVFPDGSSVVI